MRPADRDPSSCDHEAARLLSWFVVGALSEGEAVRVQEHIQACPICQADSQREQQIQSLIRDEPTVEHAPQPGLQKLMSRIDELERELPPPPKPSRQHESARAPRMRLVHWLAAAVIVQAVGLGVLGVMLWQRGAQLHAPRFQTMTSTAPAVTEARQLRVVFAPRMPMVEMQALVSSISATIVSGPSECRGLHAGLERCRCLQQRRAECPARQRERVVR